MHHRHRPHLPPQPTRRSGGIVSFLFWLGAVPVGAGLLFLAAPRSAVHVSAPPPPKRLDSLTANQLQDHAAKNGIVGGATSGQKALAAVSTTRPEFAQAVPVRAPGDTTPVVATRPVAFERGTAVRGKAVIRIPEVRSEAPHSSEDRAIADAVEVGRLKLAEYLRTLDPPVADAPEAWVIRDQYVRPGSVEKILPTQAIKDEWKAAKLNPERVWVKLDIEVSEDQLRQLRAKGRLVDAGTAGGILLALTAVLFGFLRLDAWTKGYLTTGLGIGAAVLAAVVVVAVALLM